MQNVEQQSRAINGAATPFMEGAFCDTTRRIVVISPFPAQLQQLVSELMARCYDVLMFHHAKEPILPLLQNDLIIVDQTWGTEDRLPFEASATSEFLYLVGDKTTAIPADGHTLVWPSGLEEAVAKIEELAGQSKPSAPESAERLRLKDIEIDVKRMLVFKGGARVDLTKTEYDLLLVLLTSEGVLTRQAIMEAIWGDSYFGGSNSIDVHIKSLRQKLGDDPKNPSYIATVRGVGYRIAE
ncbi:winged helix-turn-helix domain-containing protein [Cohnella thermotolerans]|uniref:winged helix-turn-helix domain-containing protein n=1 Tax=Cohnella thermotolerans TaxID=329858 RepID=UPI000428C068|nr:winged helix-turn-helix domain-containing protein [Cohnella thermotolerans]